MIEEAKPLNPLEGLDFAFVAYSTVPTELTGLGPRSDLAWMGREPNLFRTPTNMSFLSVSSSRSADAGGAATSNIEPAAWSCLAVAGVGIPRAERGRGMAKGARTGESYARASHRHHQP
jgi:hypothetical protein